jgi:hypothetical protein
MASVVRVERVAGTPLAGRDKAKAATALHERVAGDWVRLSFIRTVTVGHGFGAARGMAFHVC